MLQTVRDIVRDFDRDTPVSVSTLRDATSFEFDFRRATTLLIGVLGVLGLLLAMVGLYGTVSYLVASRTAEIGVRLALGASTTAVLWGVLGQGLKLTAWGLILGMGVSLVASRLFTALLLGSSPADPVAFAGTIILLTVISLCASLVPARRATRVNPAVALRAQ
jgi:ABC-type antimicrobial peptide transport system permease subunit